MIYLITHGERNFGPNPGHTEEGLARLASRIKAAVAYIKNPPLIVVGTGLRFIEIYRYLSQLLPNVPVQFSPFCGSADSMEADGQVILANGLHVPYAGKNRYFRNNFPFFTKLRKTQSFF